jgi:RNA polymerase sigma-32 factor
MPRNSYGSDRSFQSTLASSTEPLERTAELELTRRFRASSDRQAGNLLAKAHLRYVVVAATKYRHYGVPVAELIAEGNCGMVDALRKFDPEQGVRFATYAQHWIRAYILAYVIRTRSSLGGTSGLVRGQLFFKLRRERARMNSLLGEGRSDDEELAKRLNVSVPRLHDLIARLDCREISIDAPPDHEGGVPFADALVSSSDPEQTFSADQRKRVFAAAVEGALRSLDARERFIALNRTMAAPDDELTLAQLSESMGLSRERVRQLENRAKDKLRKSPAIRGNRELAEWFPSCIQTA